MIYSISEATWVEGEMHDGGDYYLEIVYPTLFSKGKARLFKHAHPDSLSRDHLLQTVEYQDISELAEIKAYFQSLQVDKKATALDEIDKLVEIIDQERYNPANQEIVTNCLNGIKDCTTFLRAA